MKENKSPQYELMMKGQSYHFDDYLYSLMNHAADLLCQIDSYPFGNKKRDELFKQLFASIGEKNVIKNGFKCNYGFNIEIGSGCYFNYDVKILDSYKVKIGNRVMMAPNVVIDPVTHPNDPSKRNELILKEVVIEDDVWIGANAIIMPGVTLHQGCVVGAGSLVKKDVKKNTVVAGVPARFIKMTNE